MEPNLKKPIPNASRKRFPLYLRTLLLLRQKNVIRVLSYQLGKLVDVKADTVRKDLGYIEYKGRPAYGYFVDSLIVALQAEIGSGENEKIVLIGVGNIGTGLLKYNKITDHIGKIVCAFEIDPSKIGQVISGVPVYDYSKIKRSFPRGAKIAILAIPSDDIEMVVNQLVSLKVKAIINFGDTRLRKRDKLIVHQIDLSSIVSDIIYNLSNNEKERKE